MVVAITNDSMNAGYTAVPIKSQDSPVTSLLRYVVRIHIVKKSGIDGKSEKRKRRRRRKRR